MPSSLIGWKFHVRRSRKRRLKIATHTSVIHVILGKRGHRPKIWDSAVEKREIRTKIFQLYLKVLTLIEIESRKLHV